MDETIEREKMYEMASEAAVTSRKYGLGFHGPAILGGLMLVSDDEEERHALASEAEQIIVDQGSVAHNYFWFYQFALQTALNNREWKNLERFRQGLMRQDGPSLTPWSEYFIQRSRVLEDCYRNRITDETRRTLADLLETSNRHKLRKSARELEAAASGCITPGTKP